MKLCGGILFAILTAARKTRTKTYNSYLKKSDGLTDYNLYCELANIITGEKVNYYKLSANKIISQYKKCEIDKSKYIPFTNAKVIDNYNNTFKNNQSLLLSKFQLFLDKFFLQPDIEWMINALIDIVMNDNSINKNTIIQISSQSAIQFNQLSQTQDVDATFFLTSIIHYILNNCPESKVGRETFIYLFSQESPYGEWIYSGNLKKHNNINIIQKNNNNEPDTNINKSPKKTIRLEHITKPVKKDLIENLSENSKLFCMNYEEVLDLIYLCQIAYNINPLHRHKNPMYNDYSLLSNSERKSILNYLNIKELSFDTDWISKYLSLFKKDLAKYNLSSEDYYYDDAKYFHKAYSNTAHYPIDIYNENILIYPYLSETTKRLSNNRLCDLEMYLKTSIWCTKNKPEIKITPAMDLIWETANLSHCNLDVITFWMCKFCIEACAIIMQHKSTDSSPSNYISIPGFDCYHLLSNQEDLYFYALLQLYLTYKNYNSI